MTTPETSWYRAWGLAVASEVPLAPYLPAASAPARADVRIVNGGAACDVTGPPTAQRVRLAWQGLVVDVCDGGCVMVVDEGGAARDELSQFLAGPVMGAVLAQRGASVLHASAVRLDGETIAFTAAAGVGKSTLAVLLSACGAEYLADDMVVVHARPEGPVMVVGPRLAKVADEALVPGWSVVDREALAGRCLVQAPACAHADGVRLPLDRLCVVVDSRDATSAHVTTLRGARRILAVVGADFAAPLVPPAHRHAVLERASRLAAQLPVHELSRARRLDVAASVVRALQASRSPRVIPAP